MLESNELQQQRLAALAKARLAKATRAKSTQEEKEMKVDYLDDDTWAELAALRGINLPHRTTKLTRAKAAPYLHKLGIDTTKFRAWCGYSNVATWAKKNPTFSLRALIGLLLEG
jgi:hypothetical protein